MSDAIKIAGVAGSDVAAGAVSGIDEPILQVSGLIKAFGSVQVLNGIDVSVQRGEVVSLIGPSGAGKTTFLRTLNWLDAPDAGTITIDGATIHANGGKISKKCLSLLRSKSAMVFQRYALFRNKTALENVTLALRTVHHMDADEARERGLALLDRVGLADRADRYPSQLSGGQEQRVGIARALAVDPSVVLFDEPTSALDPEWVGEVLSVMRDIASTGMTMVVVSHEMRFVQSVATRVLFLDGGKILEDGTPDQVFGAPQNPRTEKFIAQAHLSIDTWGANL